MSLFERAEYQWRETFFVLFSAGNRPTAERLRDTLAPLGGRLSMEEIRGNEQGLFESATVLAPDDGTAMDIVCVVGEEVTEQLPELLKELRGSVTSQEDKLRLEQLSQCDARLEVFHFAQQSPAFDDELADEDFLDPGGLLTVLQELGSLCHGIVVDPQSASIM